MAHAHARPAGARFAESFGRVTASAAQVVLGLDIGTTSAKAVAFDPSGATHGTAMRGYPMREPEHGHAEQDPARVLDAAEEVLRETADCARNGGAEVAGVAISTAMHALVGVGDDSRPLTPLITWGDTRAGDGDDARPLTPLITWTDTRAADEDEWLRREQPELHDRTGTPLHPMSPLPKLRWLREHAADTCAAVRRWGGLKELVLERLTGEWVVDHSVASGTGLLDLASLQWDTDALEVAGIDADHLARLVPTTEVLSLRAGAARRAGLADGTPVVAGGGDGPLA